MRKVGHWYCRVCTQEESDGAQEGAPAEGACPAAPAPAEVTLRVCRQGRVMPVTVRLAAEDGMGTSRLVHWCGAQIQVRPRALLRRGRVLASGSSSPCAWLLPWVQVLQLMLC